DSNGNDDNGVLNHDESNNHHLNDNDPNDNDDVLNTHNESNHVDLTDKQVEECITSINNTLEACTTLVDSIRLFNNLDNDRKSLMINHMSIKEFEPDQIIIEKGQIGTNFYIIMEGTAAIYEEGEDKPIPSMLGKLQYFGALSLLLNKAHERSVRATSELKCGV
ncbi:unnamed protein product, partial [Rotaria sordida]